eukprot:7481475-Karenia_brevis.AAC.1
MLARVQGGISGLVRVMLRFFFNDSNFNFAVGMFLVSPTHGRIRFTAEIGALVQDGKAHAQVHSMKGASGWKCCCSCSNIFNTDPDKLSANPNLHHYAFAGRHQFQLHTEQSIVDIVEHIRTCKMTMGKGKFELEQKIFGVVFNEHSLLFDEYLRKYYSLPRHLMHDSMHVLAASSGIGQVHVNAVVTTVFAKGGLHKLDDFARQCVVDGKK